MDMKITSNFMFSDFNSFIMNQTISNQSLNNIGISNTNNLVESTDSKNNLFDSNNLTFSPGLTIFIAIVASLMSLVTIIGNVFVITAFIIEKGLRKYSNYFILNLSIADLLIGILIPPYAPFLLYKRHWKIGRIACTLWLVFDYVVGSASVLCIVVISLDRYLLVSRGLNYVASQKISKAICIMITVWAIAFLNYAPAIIFWEFISGRRTVKDGECQVEFHDNLVYLTATACVEFFVPLISICTLNLAVYLNIRKRSRGLIRSENPKFNLPTGKSSNQITTPANPSASLKSQPKDKEENNKLNNSKKLKFDVKETKFVAEVKIENEEVDADNAKATDAMIVIKKANSSTSTSSSFHTAQNININESNINNISTTSSTTSSTSSIDELPSDNLNTAIGNNYSKGKKKKKKKDTILLDKLNNNNSNTKKNASGSLSPSKVGTPLSVVKALECSSTNIVNNIISSQSNSPIPPAAPKKASKSSLRKQNNTKSAKSTLTKDKKAARSLFILVFVFVICWAPYTFLTLIKAVCPTCVDDSIYELAFWLLWFNSTFNPILYPFLHVKFRKAFLKIIHFILFCFKFKPKKKYHTDNNKKQKQNNVA